MTYQNIPYSELLDQWQNAQDQLERAEARVYELAEKYDSLFSVLAQVCYAKNLLARGHGPDALHEVISNLGDDELATIILQLPTMLARIPIKGPLNIGIPERPL